VDALGWGTGYRSRVSPRTSLALSSRWTARRRMADQRGCILCQLIVGPTFSSKSRRESARGVSGGYRAHERQRALLHRGHITHSAGPSIWMRRPAPVTTFRSIECAPCAEKFRMTAPPCCDYGAERPNKSTRRVHSRFGSRARILCRSIPRIGSRALRSAPRRTGAFEAVVGADRR